MQPDRVYRAGAEAETLGSGEAVGQKDHCPVRIYDYADVFHCEPIAKTADEFITDCQIPTGNYDNVSACRYTVPDYWTMGEVYERLIEDICGEDYDHVVDRLVEVYTSWIDAVLCNYNTDVYYQSREYIYECHKEGQICA